MSEIDDFKKILLNANKQQKQAIEEATDIARYILTTDLDPISKEMALRSVVVWKGIVEPDNASKMALKIMYDAKTDPTKGGAKVNDALHFKNEVLNYYKNGSMLGLSTGFSRLDDFYTITKGQLNIVTGIPTHGKSEFMDQIAVNMAQNHSWKWLFFSPENYPTQYHLEKLISKVVKKPFNQGYRERMTEHDVNCGIEWVNEHFQFIDIAEYGTTLESILMLGKISKGIDGMVIDPWNEIAHNKPQGKSETDYIGESLSKIRRFARKNNIAVWVVAHPQKMLKLDDKKTYPVPTPYDINGSANWYNRADNCLTVFREKDHVEIYVQKVKFKANGKKGMVEFDYNIPTGVYTERVQINYTGYIYDN